MSPELASTTLDLDERRRRLHALYDAHVGDVYSYVHRRCGNHSTAQDVTHDVFTTVARTIDDPGEVTVDWLIRRARFRMIDIIRRLENYNAKLTLIGGSSERDFQASVADQLRVEAALEQLTPLHRTVLVLHYVDDLSVAELAEHLERSTKGAEALITRARAALIAALEVVDG